MRRLAIRVLTRFALRTQRRRPALMQRFALTEADSAWQMLQAMNASSDAALKARLFNNALEELHHAHLFRQLERSLSARPLPRPTPQRDPIIDASCDIPAFEAYHFVGEQEISEEFEAYALAAGPGRIRDTFHAISADEVGHHEVAFAELKRATGSQGEANRLVARAKRRRRYDRCNRAAMCLGNAITAGVLSLLFYAGAPFLTLVSRRRLATRRPDGKLISRVARASSRARSL